MGEAFTIDSDKYCEVFVKVELKLQTISDNQPYTDSEGTVVNIGSVYDYRAT
jgi:hypothetical protein